MQILKLLKVHSWNGAGGHNFAFYASNKDIVEIWIKSNPHDYVEEVTLSVYESFSELEQREFESAKKHAIKCLTFDQRKTLGLKF